MENGETHLLTERELARAERFYTKIRARVSNWLGNHRVSQGVHDYLLLLPDLLALVIRLVRDPRIGLPLKAQLGAAVAYVVSPLDIIPDFLLPMGLVDDTVALVYILNRLARIMGEAGDDVLREHWEGQGDILLALQGVLNTVDLVLNKSILKRLGRKFKD